MIAVRSLGLSSGFARVYLLGKSETRLFHEQQRPFQSFSCDGRLCQDIHEDHARRNGVDLLHARNHNA